MKEIHKQKCIKHSQDDDVAKALLKKGDMNKAAQTHVVVNINEC